MHANLLPNRLDLLGQTLSSNPRGSNISACLYISLCAAWVVRHAPHLPGAHGFTSTIAHVLEVTERKQNGVWFDVTQVLFRIDVANN